MVLMMVVTIAYLPIVLPFVLTVVQVNPWEIARSLIFLMLIPLALTIFSSGQSMKKLHWAFYPP